MIFRFGELFCGPGGLALGAKMAKAQGDRFRVQHVWATDKVKLLVNIPDVEHDGDIDCALSEIVRSGGQVLEVKWNGIEHTSAWAYALVPQSKVEEFQRRMDEAGYWTKVVDK